MEAATHFRADNPHPLSGPRVQNGVSFATSSRQTAGLL